MSKKIVIVDLDGTLALNQHRSHFIEKRKDRKVNWVEYFEACDRDLPNTTVIVAINLLKKSGYKIHIFSARGDLVKEKTIAWLEKYKVNYDYLTMREMNSFTPDEELKKAWLLEYYPDYSKDVFCVFDDRNKVVKMWRSLGLTCFQVAEGDF